ncbi:MAG: Cys-tRNA(Pro) deacylase [Anaerolineaceae bacterium]|nr:Cys-tRNA(Pro) deacylase [Anaerolineaceae bacterium]
MIVNNVTRFLNAKKISFDQFELPEEKLGALKTAEFLGVKPEQVFKTIVITRSGKAKPILAVVPGNHQADLKLIAQILNEKKVFLPTQAEAEKLTGLLSGGISPFALINKGWPVLLAEEAKQYSKIHLSGGQRGLNIRLAVDDIMMLLNARVGKISTIIAEN